MEASELKNKKVIVIVGPTASGKTSASIEVAKKINGEIVSADSMQIYKEMDIGTAKPSISERDGIQHYMFDVVYPNEEFNVVKYKKMAEQSIYDIIKKGKIPIVVGGTGLYISTLVKGIEFNEVAEDIVYREELLKFVNEFGANALHEKLKAVDEKSAQIIDTNNVRRVIRALEIYKVTGRKKSELDIESIKGPSFKYELYGIETKRDILYEQIEKRIDIMINSGLIEEVKNLTEKYTLSKTALQGLGYKEVIAYLKEEIDYNEMVSLLKQETRRYAKRQLTWFKNDLDVKWFYRDEIVEKIILDNL